ncbi:MAG: hypothetical protein LBF38_05870 [Deltaproteobacteria bacterium]|jgi:hypothetical protein|nr:hypothetical protein [Deltaproteobacteria bacterium]
MELDLSAAEEIEIEIIEDIELPTNFESFGGPFPYDSKHVRRVAGSLLGDAMAIAKPKAAFRVSVIAVEDLGLNRKIEIGPVVLTDQVLTDNLKDLGRVFPFLATEGPELAKWAQTLSPRDKTAAFVIRYIALKEAERRLEERLTELYGLSRLGAMSPGVLPAWPLQGQRNLFELLDPLPTQLGVSLKGETFWMIPDVSSSGLYFETEAGFHNCRLCPLDTCPLRRFGRDHVENVPIQGLLG